jgi:MFS family permease
MLRGLVHPLLLLRHPTVLWCGLIYGLYQIFFNLQAALCSGVLSAPPYNFKPNSVGLTYLAPLIATMPGAVLGGHLADRYTVRAARRNNGIAEAEHKLRLLLVPTLLAPPALLMLGLGPYYGAHWMVFVAGMFVLSLIGPLAALLAISYAFDSFHAVQPTRRDGPQAEVQQCAPYLLCVIALCMVFTFAFVRIFPSLADARTMSSRHGRSTGVPRILPFRLRSFPSRST